MGMIDGVAIGLDQSSPSAHLDLKREDAKEMRKFRPGQMVKITLVGKIDALSFRKPDDPDQSGYEGHVCIAMTKMKVAISERNQMEELLDDDE